MVWDASATATQTLHGQCMAVLLLQISDCLSDCMPGAQVLCQRAIACLAGDKDSIFLMKRQSSGLHNEQDFADTVISSRDWGGHHLCGVLVEDVSWGRLEFVSSLNFSGEAGTSSQQHKRYFPQLADCTTLHVLACSARSVMLIC